jgi:hypothetical protein
MGHHFLLCKLLGFFPQRIEIRIEIRIKYLGCAAMTSVSTGAQAAPSRST